MYKLKAKVDEAENEGRDLLEEMTFDVEIQIDDARDRLEEIIRTRMSL